MIILKVNPRIGEEPMYYCICHAEDDNTHHIKNNILNYSYGFGFSCSAFSCYHSSTITRSFEVSFDMIVFNPHKQKTKGTICLSGKSTLKKYRIEKNPIIPQIDDIQTGHEITGLDQYLPSLFSMKLPCFSKIISSWKSM